METNISKYCDFVLYKGFSKKSQKDYYSIAIKVNGSLVHICFLSEYQYNNIISSLNK